MSAQCEVTAKAAGGASMSVFERYLSLWVFLCIVAGVGLGQLWPGAFQAVARLEYAQVNLPVGLLIWVMIIPMLVKVDFGALHEVRQHVRGIGVTLFINWLVKPFSMAFLGWLFIKQLFAPMLPPDQLDSYIAGLILLAAAPCTAMVFVWSNLCEGEPHYTLSQVALNDVIDSHDPDLVVEAREEIERRERTLLECRRQLDAIRSVARNSGVGLPKWICKERNDEPANEHEQRNGIRSDGRHVLPDVRSDAADGAGEHHAGVGGRYDSGGGREPEAQPAGCGTSEREFDALITESRASINESAALVGESDAQEATLRSQRDGQIAQRDQEERTCVHRKGKTL